MSEMWIREIRSFMLTMHTEHATDRPGQIPAITEGWDGQGRSHHNRVNKN